MLNSGDFAWQLTLEHPEALRKLHRALRYDPHLAVLSTSGDIYLGGALRNVTPAAKYQDLGLTSPPAPFAGSKELPRDEHLYL